jgi:hypothetical protein
MIIPLRSVGREMKKWNAGKVFDLAGGRVCVYNLRDGLGDK